MDFVRFKKKLYKSTAIHNQKHQNILDKGLINQMVHFKFHSKNNLTTPKKYWYKSVSQCIK
jgi:hypothetical protein